MNSYIPQKSAEWFHVRLGMITSSEIWKIMPNSKPLKDGETLSQTAKTYIEEKVWEVKDQKSVEVKAWTLDYGNDHEPIAKKLLADTLQVELEDTDFTKHKDYIYYGGSCELEPFVYDAKKCSAEIKCAATGRSHAENILICRGTVDIKKVYPELYYQCQSHMILQDTDYCVFAAYHPSRIGESTSFNWCLIPRCNEDIALMEIQLAKAWVYYQEYAAMFDLDIVGYLTAPPPKTKAELAQEEFEAMAAANPDYKDHTKPQH